MDTIKKDKFSLKIRFQLSDEEANRRKLKQLFTAVKRHDIDQATAEKVFMSIGRFQRQSSPYKQPYIKEYRSIEAHLRNRFDMDGLFHTKLEGLRDAVAEKGWSNLSKNVRQSIVLTTAKVSRKKGVQDVVKEIRGTFPEDTLAQFDAIQNLRSEILSRDIGAHADGVEFVKTLHEQLKALAKKIPELRYLTQSLIKVVARKLPREKGARALR